MKIRVIDVLIGVCLFVAVYAFLYFALVRSGLVTWSGVLTGDKRAMVTSRAPYYGGVSERIFRPMHYLDKTYFRRRRWGHTSVDPTNLPNLSALGITSLFTAGTTNNSSAVGHSSLFIR